MVNGMVKADRVISCVGVIIVDADLSLEFVDS